MGNTTPATAAQISDVVTRIGPLGEVAGLSSKELAALGAAIVGVGIDESVAATGIKNLMLDMTKGTAATDKMHGVLATLGTSATDLAERMQTDATGAIMDFMRAIKQLPEAEQAAALTTYFGQESVASIAPLLSNLDNLEAQFYKVGDASQYAGSMEKEYAARAATSENTLAILKNAVKELSDTFGTIFVPNAASGAQALTDIIYKVTDFIKENKETIATVAKVTAGLLVAKTAFLGIKTVVLSVTGVYKGIKVAMAAYDLVQKGSTALKAAHTAANTAATIAATGATAAATTGTGAFAAVSGVAATGAWAMAGAFLAVAWPVLAVVAAIAAVIAIVVLLVKNWDKIKEVAGTVWESVKNVFSKIGEFFSGIFDKIKAPFVAAINWVKENWKQIITFIINPFAGIFSYLYKHFEGFRNLVDGVVEKVKGIFGAVVDWIKQNVVQPIINIFGPTVQKIGEIFGKIWEIITVLLGVLATWVNDNVITPIVSFFSSLIQTIGGIFQSVWNAIAAVFFAVVEWFTAKFTAVWEAIKTAFAPVGAFFQATWAAITTAFSNVAGWFTGVFSAAWEGIKSIFSTVGTFFQGVWDSVVAIFTTVGTAVGNAIGDAFKFVVNTVIGFAEGLMNTFINGINGAIGLINAILGVSIELLTPLQIPRLETGSNYTPDTFIAGDVNGEGGELITGARGRKVFTAAETSAILDNINAARAIVSNAPQPSPAQSSATDNASTRFNIGGLFKSLRPSISARQAESFSPPPPAMSYSDTRNEAPLTIQFHQTINVDGNKPNDLEEKLRQLKEDTIRAVDELIRGREEQLKRTAYT